MTDNPNKLAFRDMPRDDQDKIAGAIARGERVEYLVDGKWECDPPSLVFWSFTYRLPPPLIADGSLVPEETPLYMSIKPAKDPQMTDSIMTTFQPVCVSVPVGDLRHLCKLAREAGEDLQQHARDEYPDDGPTSARRRSRDISEAQKIIDAAEVMAAYAGGEA